MRSFSACVGDDVLLVGGLVGEPLAAHGATMRAGQDALLLEEPQVATDGDLRDAEILAEGGHAHGPLGLSPATIRARLSAGSISRTSEADNRLLPLTPHRS